MIEERGGSGLVGLEPFRLTSLVASSLVLLSFEHDGGIFLREVIMEAVEGLGSDVGGQTSLVKSDMEVL